MPPSHAQSSGGPQNALGIKFGGEQTATPPMDGLKTLIGAMSALNESAGYRELTHVLKEVESLRTELKTKESTIKQLEMGNQEAREKFAFANESLVDVRRKHCTELETERDDLAKEVTAMRETMKQKNQSQKVLEEQQAQMQAEVAKSQEDLNSRIASAREERQRYLRLDQEFNAAKGEIEQLKADARDKAVEISKLKESKTSLEEKHYELRQSLQSSEQELERLQGMAVELKIEPLATTRERLENLWREALFMVNKHFRFKLSGMDDETVEFGERLNDVSRKVKCVPAQSVPLPCRDSEAARNMRCALVLAWLMRLINSELFQPNYIVPVESGIRSYLSREAIRDSRIESFRRAFLLSVFPEQQTRTLEERAANVIDNIMWLVKGVIGVHQATALQSDLQTIVNLACTDWHAVQRLQDKFEPNMDYTGDDIFDWGTLEFETFTGSNSDAVSAAGSTLDEAVLVVFPRMYIVKDTEPKPVTSGIVLMKSQTEAASQQFRSEAPKSPAFGRGPSILSRDGRRRDSMIMNDPMANRNATSFLDQGVPNGPSR